MECELISFLLILNIADKANDKLDSGTISKSNHVQGQTRIREGRNAALRSDTERICEQ